MGDFLGAVRALLFPSVAGVAVDRIEHGDDGIVVHARGTTVALPCPDCSTSSTRIHGAYQRRIADYSVGGRRLSVRLTVRRFRCVAVACVRRTFVEQVDGLSTRYERSSPGLTALWRSVAVELGGRPAQRLCRVLAIPVGRTRLIGLIGKPPSPQRAPRILGVDDFAFKKGITYGTILIDVEAGRPVDLLPDRTSETLAAWLTEHPGAQIVCRDRAGAYSKAIAQAAPGVVEVADRWHLLQNLAAAVERTCHQHRACLRKGLHDASGTDGVAPALEPAALPDTALVRRVADRHQQIRALIDQGWTISAVARRLGMDRKTVRRYAMANPQVLLSSARDRSARPLDPFKPHLQQRFAAGCTTAARLYREIRELGFEGSRQVVDRYVRTLREGLWP